ncbi:MAG: hypothetical protein ACE5PT_12055, partial [Gemmatimonadales bacterium]
MRRAARIGRSAALVALLAPATRATAAAQAICSAPHSSPVLAQGGSIRAIAPGSGWVQLSGFRQVSSEFFDPTGQRIAFLGQGEVRTHSFLVTASAGVFRGVDVWAQLPVHSLVFRDGSGQRDRVGLGDPRLSVRMSPEILGATRVPLALRGGLKLPGTSFPVDATIIPISEGQRDWELSLESGTVVAGTQAYLMGWLGYRWRELNASRSRKPGNELFAHLAAGGSWRGLRAEVGWELLLGEAPRQLGVEIPASRRRL